MKYWAFLRKTMSCISLQSNTGYVSKVSYRCDLFNCVAQKAWPQDSIWQCSLTYYLWYDLGNEAHSWKSWWMSVILYCKFWIWAPPYFICHLSRLLCSCWLPPSWWFSTAWKWTSLSLFQNVHLQSTDFLNPLSE